ncbi:MAG: hypothetical protein HQK54_16435 [Oligoflexales bacterium]|nr:hypothetical protein [Oligoflexales bacterium]
MKLLYLTFIQYIFVFGCTTVDLEALKKTKKVAIIGLNGKVNESESLNNNLVSNLGDQEFGPKLYQVAAAELGKGFSWQFVSLDKVKNSPGVKSASEKALSQVIYLIDRKDLKIRIPGLPSSSEAVGLASDEEKKAQLMKELGVDALMEISFEVNPVSQTAGFMPKIIKGAMDVVKFKCSTSFKIYNKEKKDPIWNKAGFSSESSDEVTVTFFGVTFPDERVSAVVSSFVNSMQRAISDAKSSK